MRKNFAPIRRSQWLAFLIDIIEFLSNPIFVLELHVCIPLKSRWRNGEHGFIVVAKFSEFSFSADWSLHNLFLKYREKYRECPQSHKWKDYFFLLPHLISHRTCMWRILWLAESLFIKIIPLRWRQSWNEDTTLKERRLWTNLQISPISAFDRLYTSTHSSPCHRIPCWVSLLGLSKYTSSCASVQYQCRPTHVKISRPSSPHG